jgi:hypothetical protein
MNEPPNPGASQPTEWLDMLNEKLATDEDFRRLFERTPGKAANSIGIPYDAFKALLAEQCASDRTPGRWADYCAD